MDIRTLVNEKLTQAFTAFMQGDIQTAQDAIEELITTLEAK